MVINERDGRNEYLIDVARQMMTAARTAPKAKGADIIEICMITGDSIKKLSEKMLETGEEKDLKFFLRDSENILQAGAVVLIGTKIMPHSLNCGYCGYGTCDEKLSHAAVPCALNAADVGIAVGSACATAADMRVDTRVMFSAGYAAGQIGLLPGCSNIYAVPLSISSKNPFFDRRPKQDENK